MSRQTDGKAARAVYWTATTVIALAFITGGAAYLFHGELQIRGMAALGYPDYFVTILGIWKVLGGVVLLAPAVPLLKEWAYAGVAFDLTGAAFSHASVGDPALKVIVPLVLLGVSIASWLLRPATRRLVRSKIDSSQADTLESDRRAA